MSLGPAGVAHAGHEPPAGASLEVWTTPREPHYVDTPTIQWRFEKPWSSLAILQMLVIQPPAAASTAAAQVWDATKPCPATAREAHDKRYQPPANPPGRWRSHPVSTNQTEASGENRMDNLIDLPQGSYVLCGYMYDFENNPEVPYLEREWGGHPDVYAQYPFTVSAPSASVSLEASPRSVHHRSTEKVALKIPWSAEPRYSEYGWGAWPPGSPELGVMLYPRNALRGSACPELKPTDPESNGYLGLAGNLSDYWEELPLGYEEPEPRVGRGTLRTRQALHMESEGGVVLRDMAPSPGNYSLCAYIFTANHPVGDPAWAFEEARSKPVSLALTRGGPGTRLCASAKKKLANAKAALTKAKRRGASSRKLRKLNAKVKRAQETVDKDC